METDVTASRANLCRHRSFFRSAQPECRSTHSNSGNNSAGSATIQLSFNVERAIAGVETGQVLTIHEWAGASSMHRAMKPGQHFLLFLYPPSRLGFTSPVGGESGEVLLDGLGQNVSDPKLAPTFKALAAPDPPAPIPSRGDVSGTVSVNQLERAIRNARSSREK
jgi:hypothetical protein